MSITRCLTGFAAALAFSAALAAPTPSAAQTGVSPWVRVSHLQAGWVVDRMLVFPLTGALTNPGGCSIVTNGYIIKESDPGHRTFYAMLLSAFLNQREVAFVIDGCFEQRPRIVSVSIR